MLNRFSPSSPNAVSRMVYQAVTPPDGVDSNLGNSGSFPFSLSQTFASPVSRTMDLANPTISTAPLSSTSIAWAIGWKYTDGCTKLWPTIGTIGSLVASFLLLGLALKTLPVGTAYAIWVGIGALGTASLGILLFGESADVLKLVSLGLIFAGIVGLKVASA